MTETLQWRLMMLMLMFFDHGCPCHSGNENASQFCHKNFTSCPQTHAFLWFSKATGHWKSQDAATQMTGHGQFWGFFTPLKSIGSLCSDVLKKGWTDRDAVYGADLFGLKETRWKSRSDESIHRREGWQDSDAAFRQNYSTTYYYYGYFIPRKLTIIIYRLLWLLLLL